VGLSAIMGARLVNAFPICAVDINDKKLRLAHHLGANICGNQKDCRGNYDVVIETTGNPAMIEWALDSTAANGGRLVLVGQPPVGEEVSFCNFRKHYFGKTIMDSQGGSTIPHLDIPRLLRLYSAGRLPISHLATDRYPLSQINEATEAVRTGEVLGRCMITV
jgi:Zn-dependent alcohol dehydrogenase